MARLSHAGPPPLPARTALAGWGHSTSSAAVLERPASVADLAAAVLTAGSRGALARGLGRGYGDAAQNAGGLVLELTSLGGASEVDPVARTVSAPAGATLHEVLCATLPHGLVWPVLPGTRHVTVGGAIAADIHGKNSHRHGSLGQWVTGLSLLDAAGRVRELAPDRDPDAFWATVGGLGLTGVIVRATVRLLPVSTSRVLAGTIRAGNLDEVFAAMSGPAAGSTYTVAWLDALASGPALGRGVVSTGEFAPVDALPAAEQADPLRYRPRPAAAVPPLPTRLVNPAVVRAHNSARWRVAPTSRVGQLVELAEFFHPLDVLADWYRLYGRRGFIQYQFVVPPGASELVRQTLERSQQAGVPPYLVVLKNLGGQPAGPLSFPLAGWTLALDYPVGSPALPALLDELDEAVAAAGGRVYLVKDGRLRPPVLAASYPRLAEWQAARDRLDPDRRWRSDLGRRLGL